MYADEWCHTHCAIPVSENNCTLLHYITSVLTSMGATGHLQTVTGQVSWVTGYIMGSLVPWQKLFSISAGLSIPVIVFSWTMEYFEMPSTSPQAGSAMESDGSSGAPQCQFAARKCCLCNWYWLLNLQFSDIKSQPQRAVCIVLKMAKLHEYSCILGNYITVKPIACVKVPTRSWRPYQCAGCADDPAQTQVQLSVCASLNL